MQPQNSTPSANPQTALFMRYSSPSTNLLTTPDQNKLVLVPGTEGLHGTMSTDRRLTRPGRISKTGGHCHG